MFCKLIQEEDLSLILDTEENLFFFEIEGYDGEKSYTQDYTKDEVVIILKNFLEVLEG